MYTKSEICHMARKRLADLHREAADQIRLHRQYRSEENKGRTHYRCKSMLYPIIRKNKYGFKILWVLIEWWHLNKYGRWMPRDIRYLSRRKDNTAGLDRYAREWEIDAVRKLELNNVRILNEVDILDGLLRSYNRLQNRK